MRASAGAQRLGQLLRDNGRHFTLEMSGGNYMFVMVGEGDTPIYEAEFLNVPRVRFRHRCLRKHAGAASTATAP